MIDHLETKRESERIVWIDVETTGIDANIEKLLQVACIVTDGNLNPLNEGWEAKVSYSMDEVSEMKENCIPFVRDMHDKTGLWQALVTDGISVKELEKQLLEEIRLYTEKGTARIGGNSITLDRNFINKNLPVVGDYLSYRSYDMSSISGWFELHDPSSAPFEKENVHEALDDIRASIAEGRYYMELIQSRVPPF